MPHALLIDGDAAADPELDQRLVEIGFDSLFHAHDVENAITIADQCPPDLVVICDGLSADAAIATARRICSKRDIPVLMATRDSRRVSQSLAHGAVLVGHFSFSKLPEAVETALASVAECERS